MIRLGKSVPIEKINAVNRVSIKDTIPVELILIIILNNRPVASVSCLPDNLIELAIGYLLNNGYIKKYSDIVLLRLCEKELSLKKILTMSVRVETKQDAETKYDIETRHDVGTRHDVEARHNVEARQPDLGETRRDIETKQEAETRKYGKMRIPDDILAGSTEDVLACKYEEIRAGSTKDVLACKHEEIRAGNTEDVLARNYEEIRAGNTEDTEGRIKYIPAGCGSFDDIILQKEQEIGKIKSRIKVSSSIILKLNLITLKNQKIKKEFGGLHSSALFDYECNCLCIMEDIGRHNCIDKLAGYLAIRKMDPSCKIIFTTGRLSIDIIFKIYMMSVAIIVSNSSITHSAVLLAKRAGITSIGYLRGGRFNIYSNPSRITT